MANPIPYNQLFDVDGLKSAIKEAEAESDKFGDAATEDFNRINNVVKALRKELEGLGVALSKPIKIGDDSAQEQIRNLSIQVSELTHQYNAQKAAIAGLKGVMDANKAAVSDAKLKSAEYEAQLKKERVATQEARTAVVNLTLEMKKQAQANREAKQSQGAANGSYKEAQQRLTAIGNAIRNTKDGFKSQTPELQAQILQYKNLNESLKKFDAQMGNHQRNVGDYKGALSGLVGDLKNLALSYISIQGALQAANYTFDTALSQDATRASLTYTLQSADIAEAKMQELGATANRLGIDFNALTTSYAMFAGAAKAANYPLDEANKIFNSIIGAGARFHLSADQITGSLLAIQQMISKGTVQSEELRGQLSERLPGAFSIAARAMGVTEMELGKLLKSGSVLASELLPKLSVELDKTFSLDKSTKIDSLTAAWNRFKNVFSEVIESNSRVTTFFSGLIEGVTRTSDILLKTVNSSSWKEFFYRVGALAGGATGNVGAAIINSSLADVTRAGNNPTQSAIVDFTSQSRDKQIEQLKTLTTIRDNAFKQAEKGNKADVDYLIQQNNLLHKLTDVYKGLYGAKKGVAQVNINGTADTELTSIKEIRDRIKELSKMPGSAIDGSEINNRIDALKARLASLKTSTKQVKDGFAILEEQMKKVMYQLQDAILIDYAKHQGKESDQTKKLATEYQNLTNKLIALHQAKKDALFNVAKQQQISTFGSIFPIGNNADPKLPTAALNTSQAGLDANAALDNLDDVYIKYAETNRKIVESYKARNITKLEYDAQMLASEKQQATEEYYYTKINLANELIVARDTYGENSKQYRKVKKEISKTDEEYSKKSIQNTVDTEEAKRRIIDETVSYVKRAAQRMADVTGNAGLGSLFSDLGEDLINNSFKFQNFADLAIDATTAYTDYAINASKARQQQMEEELQRDLNLAGDNADAKIAIQQAYDAKVRQEQRKQAILQKEQALIDVAINTAVAVTKVAAITGPFAFLLAPAIIALGAIEAGLILSQPIPSYEKGRDGGRAEIAEVNERGPELIGQKGKYRIANSGKRGLAYLNKGDDVVTATDTKMLMANNMLRRDAELAVNVSQSKAIYDTYVMTASRANGIDYDRMAGAVAEGVSGLPVTEHNYNERGYQRNLRSKNTRMIDAQKRNNF